MAPINPPLRLPRSIYVLITVATTFSLQILAHSNPVAVSPPSTKTKDWFPLYDPPKHPMEGTYFSRAIHVYLESVVQCRLFRCIPEIVSPLKIIMQSEQQSNEF
jgi:hypothetical protein